MIRQRLMSLVFALLGMTLVIGQVDAQTTSFPVTPDPALCVERISITEFGTLLKPTAVASPVAVVPTGSPVATTPLDGEPGDQATIDAINERVIAFAACINAENTLGFYGQFSPNAIRAVLGNQNITDADLAALAATTPTPADSGDWITIRSVREVRVQADGRVGALVDSHFPILETEVKVDFFTFSNVDGQWLIDSIVEGLETVYPPRD